MSNLTVTEYFEKDHDRLDEEMRQFRQLKRKNFDEAKPHFREFLTGLQRHIVWEEEVLFPTFEEKTGINDGGPTAVMRSEHLQIKGFLDALHEKVRRKDPDSDAEEISLLSVLSAHNEKEERILYPAIDANLSDTERKGVFQKMSRIPEERYAQCCGGHHAHAHGRA